jgi:hypothetical protein
MIEPAFFEHSYVQAVAGVCSDDNTDFLVSERLNCTQCDGAFLRGLNFVERLSVVRIRS